MPFEKMPGDVPIFGPGAPPAPTAPSKSGRWQPLPAEDVELHGPPGAPKQQLTWGETGIDAARSAPGGVGSGVANLIGTPRAVADALGSGLDRLGNRVLGDGTWGNTKNYEEEQQRHQTHVLPSGEGIQQGMEAVTGPWYQPKSGLGKATRETVDIGTQMLLTGGSGGIKAALGKAGAATVAKEAAKDVPRALAFGAPPAAAGAAVDAIVPEDSPWHTPLRMGAQMAAGAAAPMAGSAVKSTARFAEPYIGTKGWQGRSAAEELRSGAMDPDTLEAKIAAGQDEIVPGSKQTMGHMTGDEGILRQQQHYMDGDLGRQAEVSARTRAQDQARSQFMENAAPDNADRMDVVSAVRQHMDNIDQHYQQQSEAARQAAIKQATDAVGQTAVDPTTIGNSMRNSLRGGLDKARQDEKAFWEAIDPQNRYTVGTRPLHGAAEDVYAGMTPTDWDTVTPREYQVLSRLRTYGDQLSFGEALSYKRMLGDALDRARKDGYGTAESNRLAALYQKAKAALSDGLEQHTAREAEAVRTGRMSPEATLAAEVERWRAARAQDQAGTVGRGYPDPAGSGPAPVGGVGGVRGLAGAEGGPGGGPTARPSVPGMAGVAGRGATPMDAAARARLIRANDATKDRIERFRDPSQVKDTLATGTGGDYRLRPSAVPEMHWTGGNQAGQKIDDYFRAGGDKDALLQAAYASMHKSGVIKDGVFDPAAYQAWRNRHQWALGRLERRAPGTSQQFANAETAAQAYQSADMAHKVGMKALNDSMLGRIKGITNESDVPGAMRSLLRDTKVGEMAALHDAIKGNPEAVKALHRSIVDHMTSRFTNGRGSLKSDSFARFVREAEPNLRAAGMSNAQINVMKRIAKDWEVNTREPVTGRNSNTAARTMPFSKKPQEESALHNILRQATGFQVWSGLWTSAFATGIADTVLKKLETRKLTSKQKVDALVWAAMQDPKGVGLPLLQKYPVKPTPEQKSKLIEALKRMALSINGG
jgi:hypothetical protein